MLGLMTVVSAGLAWITFYINWSLLTANYPRMLEEGGLYPVFQEVGGTIFWTTLTIIFIAIFIGGALGLVVSRRITGPLLRFQKVAASIAGGGDGPSHKIAPKR